MTRGQRNIKWIEAKCRVPEGRDVGKPLKLRRFQRRIIRGIYDNKVPTRYVIVSMAKKNAKTTLSGCLLLLHLVGPESKENSQLYSTGQSREQAAVIFELAAKMVRQSPDLSAYIVIRESGKELACPERGTVYKALSADAHTAHGKSPVFVVHDELGQVVGPTSDLFDALETADGAHEQPLTIIISTQAAGDGDLLSLLIDDGLSGKDPATVVFLWTADEEGHENDPEWIFSEEAMRQANPALGDFLSLTSIKQKAELARRMPSKEARFRNFNLNQRIAATSPFVSRRVWLACGGQPIPPAKGAPTYIGLDLSARNDLTADVLISEGPDRIWDAVAEFYAPALGVADRAQRDRAPYDVWADEGLITLTPGATVDYEVVGARLLEHCDQRHVAAVAYDRWRMDVLIKELARLMGIDTDADDMRERVLEVVPLIPFGQGFRDMAPALDTLEAVLINRRLRHGGHEVLTWCAANAKVSKDPAGNRKLDKVKSTGRIDGMQALAMAFGAAGVIGAPKQDGESVYETRGLLEA